MNVQLYSQSQLGFAKVNKNKPQPTVENQSNPIARANYFGSANAYSAQISQINFTAALKTNYIKEIFEQPKVIKNLLDKYFPEAGKVSNMDLKLSQEDLKNMTGIKIVASGSSKNVAEMARDFIEEVTGIPVDVHYASEFAHKNSVVNKNDLMVFISQSGETADTYAALQKANSLGLKSIALTNTPSSKIHQNASAAVEVGAGKELAVAATKSVTAQLINLYTIALKLGETKGTVNSKQIEAYADELKTIPGNLEKMLKDTKCVKTAAQALGDKKDIFVLGRGSNVGSIMEGSLKLRETTYANPTPSASGEFLHGYIASVDKNTPVIQVVQGMKGNENYELANGNLKEIVKKRTPDDVIIIKNQSNKEIEKESLFEKAHFMDIPTISEKFSPMYVVPRFQMLANELTKLQGKNPDMPRSLTKAVLSE